jgi:NodT family efflux transporter outer membrane factor (OMF) lipoprotein
MINGELFLNRPPSAPLVVLLLLSACSHHDYVRDAEQLTVPDSFPETTVATEPAAEVCSTLGGPELATLRDRMGIDNLDLKVAAARLEQAEALALSSRSGLLPRLDVTVQGSRGQSRFGSGDFLIDTGLANQYQASLAASYEVDIWGRVRQEYRAGRFSAEAAAQGVRLLDVSLSAQLADVWIAVIAYRQLSDLIEQQITTSHRFRELLELRFQLGQAQAADVARQNQQLLALEGQLELSRGRLAILQTDLAVLLGSTDADMALAETRVLPALPAAPGTVLPASLVTERPDLRAAFLQLAAADAKLGATTAGLLPSLGLSANLNSVENQVGDLFGDTFWQVGLKASQAVFDFGLRRSRVAAADAQAQQAYYEFAGSLVRAINEVSATLAATESQDNYVLRLQRQLDESRNVLKLTRDGYRLGQQSFLDVLAAEQSQQSLEQQMVEAKRMQFSNRVQLCRSLGKAPGAQTQTESGE